MSETPKKKAIPRKTAPKKKAVSSVEQTKVIPSHQEVELLAYQIWVDRGKPHGDDAQDWLRAEEQLRLRQ